MSRRATATALAALAALAVWTAGCDALMPRRSLGETVWRERCAKCHGLDGSGNTPRYMGHVYADLLDDSWSHGGDRESIEAVIRNGVLGEMPPFDMLSDDEVRAVIDYLRELRGEAEPGSAR